MELLFESYSTSDKILYLKKLNDSHQKAVVNVVEV